LTTLIKLDSNENPFGPSPLAIKAMQAALPDCSGYPDDQASGLRRKLADHPANVPWQARMAELLDVPDDYSGDDLGIAKTAREEKLRKQRARIREQQENDRMAKLYRQHVLKEPASPEAQIVQIQLKSSKPQPEVTPSGFGD